jgi:hypothetical protein
VAKVYYKNTIDKPSKQAEALHASKVVVSWPVLWIDTPIPEIWLLHIISRNHDSTFGIAKPGIYNSELQPKREICKQVLESTTSGSQLILLNGMDLNYKS